MFKYQDTGKVSEKGEQQLKIVTKVREVTYYNDSSDPKIAKPVITKGFEIVEEKVVSPNFKSSLPLIVGQKTVDNRNPNRVVREVL
jgi:hypothetical protein